MFPGDLVKFSDEVQKPPRKKRRKKPTPEPNDDKKAKIIRLHKQRYNQRQISEKLKVSPHHVSKTIKVYNEEKHDEVR